VEFCSDTVSLDRAHLGAVFAFCFNPLYFGTTQAIILNSAQLIYTCGCFVNEEGRKTKFAVIVRLKFIA